MAIPKLLTDLAFIAKMLDNPRQNGLSTESFKREFDKAPLLIQKYLNDTLIPELDKLVDVEALLKSVLDPTLTKNDMAAQADVVGRKLVEVLMRSITAGAAMFENTVQSGDYVLRKDQNFEILASGAYKFRIGGGAWVMQGNYCEANIGSYVDVTCEAGATGLYRHDLICARYSRDESGNATNSLVLIPGETQTSDGIDPAYNSDDINAAGAATRDLPLYRIILKGTDVSLESIFEVQEPIDRRRTTVAVTISADGWVDNQQQIDVEGVTADPLKSDVLPSPDPSDENYAAYTENGVRLYSQLDGAVIFKCESVPGIDLIVNVMVLR